MNLINSKDLEYLMFWNQAKNSKLLWNEYEIDDKQIRQNSTTYFHKNNLQARAVLIIISFRDMYTSSVLISNTNLGKIVKKERSYNKVPLSKNLYLNLIFQNLKYQYPPENWVCIWHVLIPAINLHFRMVWQTRKTRR